MVDSNMSYAPIVIFAFNRLKPLKACVASLLNNSEASKSDLIVYVDGARPNKEGEAEKVMAVREYVKTITGFKSVTYHYSENNKGLAPSIISGVSKIIEEYGKVIVIEDDLFLAPSFLCYMNQMLDYFENDNRVFQVSGYSSRIEEHKKTKSDVYLNLRGQCWSWGTWKNRWNTIDWNVADFDEFSKDREIRRKWENVGHDLYGMLKSWKSGRLNSWWIRFSYNMFRQNRFTVCPVRSLVRNDGFGMESTHCNAYNRYKIDFNDECVKSFYIPNDLTWDSKFNHYATRYWSFEYRVYGKLMTYLYRLIGKKF